MVLDKESFGWALFSSVFKDNSFLPQMGVLMVTVSKTKISALKMNGE